MRQLKKERTLFAFRNCSDSIDFCIKEEYSAFGLAEAIPGDSTTEMQAIAKELGVVMIVPLFEKRAEGVYHNSAAVIDADGAYLGKYRKMHIPDDPSFYEKFYFTPGDLGFRSWKTRFGTIGVLICWDQWYPEAARLTALAGAEILFYPTAIGWANDEEKKTQENQFQAWQIIQRSHAVANGIPVVAVNRVGTEENLKFWGAFVCCKHSWRNALSGIARQRGGQRGRDRPQPIEHHPNTLAVFAGQED